MEDFAVGLIQTINRNPFRIGPDTVLHLTFSARRRKLTEHPAKEKTMSELKTKVTEASVDTFLAGIKDERQRKETITLFSMMQKATKAKPKMWGSSIIGFGEYHYLGKSGREGDWFLAGISPRKQAITLYMCTGWEGNKTLLKQLGQYSLGVGCLYIKRLDDIDLNVMKRLIADSLKRAKAWVKEDAKRQAVLKKK